jgi:hypothetical protein
MEAQDSVSNFPVGLQVDKRNDFFFLRKSIYSN